MLASESKSERLKEIILADMKEGVYGPDAAMPSIRELCRRYEVCKHTASQAVLALKELGLVDVSHGKQSRRSAKASDKVVHVLFVGRALSATSEFWGDVYDGMAEAFATDPSYACEPFAVPTGDTMGDFKQVLNPVTSRGVILVGIENNFKNNFLKETGLPFVVACQRVSDATVHHTVADLAGAMTQLVQAFKERGRRRLAFLGPFSADTGMEREKVKLFGEFAAAASLPAQARDCSFELDDVYQAAVEMLKREDRPDALFVSSGLICQAVYRAAVDCGLRLPEDLSIAGCDNLRQSRFMTPSLSCVDMPRRELGRLAVESLFKLMDGLAVPRRQTLEAKFIRRESI